jgi:hypothetical protein
VPLWHGEASFELIPQSGTARSSVRSISNFLRKLQIDFQSNFNSLQSHQQWRSVSLSPHPHQHVLSPEDLILAILIGLKWNLRVNKWILDKSICTEYPRYSLKNSKNSTSAQLRKPQSYLGERRTESQVGREGGTGEGKWTV